MAYLILIQDGSAGVRFPIDSQQMTIGRSEDNNICLDDELVSKHHAVLEAIVKEDEDMRIEYYLHDQDSTNHSFVNDERVKIRRLSHDDIIRIGKSNFRFVDDSHDELDATTKLQKTWIPGVYLAKKAKSKSKKKSGKR
ncbi:MAG: FHA domain-containing protein [Thioalkalispiraceae bacterium]|jgi:pSer/pThr/pTyr-binding forkhead associated (FHA) protein